MLSRSELGKKSMMAVSTKEAMLGDGVRQHVSVRGVSESQLEIHNLIDNIFSKVTFDVKMIE